jgi:ribosomal protein S16
MSKIKYNTKFLKSHTFYFMRLQVYRRYQKPIYKIVVVNQNNRIVHTLGYYNPFKINFRTSYRTISQSSFMGKVISIDRYTTMSWLRKGVIPSLFLSFILNDMGLLKTHSSDSSRFSNDFIDFKTEVYKLLPIIIEKLD